MIAIFLTFLNFSVLETIYRQNKMQQSRKHGCKIEIVSVLGSCLWLWLWFQFASNLGFASWFKFVVLVLVPSSWFDSGMSFGSGFKFVDLGSDLWF